MNPFILARPANIHIYVLGISVCLEKEKNINETPKKLFIITRK